MIGNQDQALFTSEEARQLLKAYLEKAEIKLKLSDALKYALHEGIVTAKVGGEFVSAPRYILKKGKTGLDDKLFVKEEKEWRLKITLVPFEAYFPDPNAGPDGEKLYEIHRMETDLYRILDKEDIYDKETVLELIGSSEETDEDAQDTRAGYSKEPSGFRKRQVIDEFWGTILDDDGTVAEWEGKELRNVVCAVLNGRAVIRMPEANPRWANCSPFISAPLLRTPDEAFSKAVMDMASELNITLVELFNLIVDGALMSVWGIRQLREHWLADTSAIDGNIPPGTVLKVSARAPLGAKVYETVSTGTVPPEALRIFEFIKSLYQEATLGNDIRTGNLPAKQVKATEIVQATQALAGIFDGLAGDFEDHFVEKLLDQCWYEILQNVDKFPADDLERILGAEKAQRINSMSAKERFKLAARGFKFRGKGMSMALKRIRDFQRLMQFLSVLGTRPELMDEFNTEYDFKRLMEELLYSLEIDAHKLRRSDEEIARRKQLKELNDMILAEAQGAVAGGGLQGNAQEGGASSPLPQLPGQGEPALPPEGQGGPQ